MSSNTGKIDWSEIHRAIKRAEQSTEAAINPAQEQIEQILLERAGQLAIPKVTPVAGDQLDLMLFTVGDASLAIETRYVRGVARAGRITRLHGGPAHLLGVSNYQGDVIAVVDAGLLPLHAHRQKPVVQEDAPFLLVLGDVQVELAFLVNSIDGQVRLPATRINHSSTGVASAEASGLMQGIIAGLTDDDLVSVFDGDVLLQDSSLYFDI